MTTPTSEPVDILLIGGPSDGCVRQIDPAQEDGCTVRYLNGPDEGTHEYLHFVFDDGELAWNFGVHRPLVAGREHCYPAIVDIILRELIQKHRREELVIYVQPA